MPTDRVNKLAVALACRAAMQEHRKGKPIAFQLTQRPHVRPQGASQGGGLSEG